jgi:hypothetical protein
MMSLRAPSFTASGSSRYKTRYKAAELLFKLLNYFNRKQGGRPFTAVRPIDRRASCYLVNMACAGYVGVVIASAND